jgi:hypothetical protein
MTNTPAQAPSTWYSRNRLPFIAIIAVLLFMPSKWTDMAVAALFAALALHGVIDAVVVLIRTRWYFRVASYLLYAGFAAVMSWAKVSSSDGWGRSSTLFGLVTVLVAWSLFSDFIEQRRYPNQVLAFKNAQATSGRWGWLSCRQIPWIRNDGQ